MRERVRERETPCGRLCRIKCSEDTSLEGNAFVGFRVEQHQPGLEVFGFLMYVQQERLVSWAELS